MSVAEERTIVKKLRQFASLVLTVAMAVSLCACGGAKKAETKKLKVGISWSEDNLDTAKDDYCNAVIKAGGEPVYLAQFKTEEEAAAALKDLDALVMTGGEDIDPSYYHEDKDPLLETTNEARDVSDYALINAAIKADIPTLCTCRGMQFLNIICGGTLYQDFPSKVESDIIHRDPNHKVFVYHDITVDGDNIVADAFGGAGTYEVNSWHHQAVDKLGDHLKVVAKSADGIIEAVVKDDNTYFMGLQFHPEALIVEDGKDAYLPFYQNLLKAAETKKQK